MNLAAGKLWYFGVCRRAYTLLDVPLFAGRIFFSVKRIRSNTTIYLHECLAGWWPQMLYRLFIYKSTAASCSALAVRITNAAVSIGAEREWKGNEAAKFMGHFNAENVKMQIEAEAGSRCNVYVCCPPDGYEQKKFLYIATSYAMAREVLPILYTIAMKNSLLLYDAETGKSFFKNLFDNTLITFKIRKQELLPCIMSEMKPVWKLHNISGYYDKRNNTSSYTLTVRRDPEKTFLERTEDLYNCLKGHLWEDERLVCENRAFTVSGEGYSLIFTFEGYYKHADKSGYYENGRACWYLTRRMNMEVAHKWMNGCSDIEKEIILKRMNFREMVDKFPNPADRLAASIRITKWQRKQIFGVSYDGLGPYGAEIIFHVVPDDCYQNADSISVLKIDEDAATFILPFIHDIYPYFYKRYSAENHVPCEMWRDITNRIKEARRMIVNDTYSPDLARYIGRFDLFVLGKYDDPRILKSSDDYSPADFVYEHRYEIAHLYEIFIQWSETQLDCYAGERRMFNIEGP